jgi:Arc/MetJ-type ribon-helix-helix transcriptional regulator
MGYPGRMTKKIGVSLRDDLYEWATREVEEGRSESVSALVADGLNALRGYAELEDLVQDLAANIGEIDGETMARVEAAERAAAAAYRDHLARKAKDGQAA